MEKFLEIKNKEKELDQAKNALFDFEEGQKDVSSTELTSTELHSLEHSEDHHSEDHHSEDHHSEDHHSEDDKNSLSEENKHIISLNHSDQIRDILQQIDPTKSNKTGIEIEFKLKVPKNNGTVTKAKNIENKTQGTELVLQLNGIKPKQAEIALAKPTRDGNMENKTLVQKLNEIKQKQKEIASAKSSILTELEVKHSSDNASLSSEVAHEAGDASKLVEKIKDIKDKEIKLKKAKTLLFTDHGKSEDHASAEMKSAGEKGNKGNNETKNVEEIRIVLQQGTKAEREDSSHASSNTSTILQTDSKKSGLPSASNISAVPPDLTLRPSAVVDAETQESSDSEESELKKIRIVLDVKDGSNLSDSSNIVNTDDNKIKLD